MEVYSSKDIAVLLRDNKIIEKTNKILSDKNWLYNLEMRVSEYEWPGDISKDISEITNEIVDFLKEVKSSKKSNEGMNLRIYNDKSSSFKYPLIMPMQNLNDPMEGMWNFKNISYSTALILETLKGESLISACYTTHGGDINNKYMIDNYSRKNRSWIYFSKEKFDECLEAKGDVFFGYVTYDKKTLNKTLIELKRKLNINKNTNTQEFSQNLLIYLTLEIILNLFYKWREMAEEREYRAIKIGKLSCCIVSDHEDINIDIKNDNNRNHTLGDKNKFYQLTDSVKNELK